MKNVLGIVFSYVFIALIIVSAKAFIKSGKEATRKYIHIMLCNWWFIAMYFFDGPIWAGIVPLSFVFINYISYKKNLIDVMERDLEDQDGLGTVYYAISLLIISILSFGVFKNPNAGLAAILIMGYGDGLAAIIGKILRSKKFKIKDTTKSLAGSLTMFIITVLAMSIYFISISASFWYIKAIILAAITTVIEAVSIKGTDNITVPVWVYIILTIVK